MTKLEKIEAVARDLAGIVEMALGELAEAAGYGDELGYALLTFDMASGGNMVWMSNAQRGDMIDALRELLVGFETNEADGLRSGDVVYDFKPGAAPRRCTVGQCMAKSNFEVEALGEYHFPCGPHLSSTLPDDAGEANIERLDH